MADNVNITRDPTPPSGSPGGGLYLIVGMLVVAILVGGFFMFGGRTPVGGSAVATNPSPNVNLTVQPSPAPAATPALAATPAPPTKP